MIYLVVPGFALAGVAASVVLSYIVLIPIFAWTARRKSGIAFQYHLLLRPFLTIALGLAVAGILSAVGAHPLLAKLVGLLAFGWAFLNYCLSDQDFQLLHALVDQMPGSLRTARVIVRGAERVRLDHRIGSLRGS